MKTKLAKILGVVLSLALLSSLAMIAVPVSAAGDPDVVDEWEELNLPETMPDTDVEIIEQAEDGTIFVSIYNEGEPGSWSMYKSSDGYMWDETCLMELDTRITAIEPSDNYAEDETVYVAVDTSDAYHTTIYRCTGAADDDVVPGILGQISAGEHGTTAAVYIYDLDSYYDGDDVWLLAATDIDVFAIPDDNGLTTIWTDMELSETLGGEYADGPDTTIPSGAYPCVEVFKSMFAPDFASTGVIWAVYADEFDSPGLGTTATNGYGLIARSSGSTLWGTVITPVIVDSGDGRWCRPECDVEFAADYSSTASPNLYAALAFYGQTDADDIYSIECDFYGSPASVTPFDVDPSDRIDFCSLEVSGSLLIAGSFDQWWEFDNTEIWFSLNNGITWNMASKNPTGEADHPCALLISTAGSSEGLIFAGTGGEQSAISISEDDGDTWNQIAFIDDVITWIKDIAFDPTSTSALLITVNDVWDDSLWKTDDINDEYPEWQRVFCENYSTDINFTLAEYSMDGNVVMVWDEWEAEIYRSSDDAQTFTPYKSTAAWGYINDWAIYDSSSVYAACSNGFWSTAVVGSDLTTANLVSIALQTGFDPDDSTKDVLIVGDDSGNAYISYNAGDDLEAAVDVDGTSYPVHVAFGPDNVVYLTEGDDVYYAAIGATNLVVSTSNTLGGTSEPLTGWFVDIAVSPDNTLYVLNNDADLARYLIGDKEWDGDKSEWDIVWNYGGVTDELWVTPGSNVAWTIDHDNDSVNLIDDTLTGKVTGLTFSDITPFSFVLEWNEMEGATDYEVNIYELDEEGDEVWWDVVITDEAMLDIEDEWGEYALPPATDFMVEVRVNNDGFSSIGNEIEYSRWSTAASVMTDYFMTTPIPTNPGQGADEVSLTPSFGWSAVEWAVTYTFQLSDDPEFDSLIDSVSVTTTAYSYVGDGLDYDSDYYWRVQAVAPNGTKSDWSTFTERFNSIEVYWGAHFLWQWTSGAISNFHTEEEEFPPVTVEPAPTPTIILPTPTVIVPDITLPPMPDITIEPPVVTVPITSTVTTVNPVIELPDQPTPVYIWAIVAIGGVLTIAVIILIIRTRRVV